MSESEEKIVVSYDDITGALIMKSKGPVAPRHCRSVYIFDFTVENDDRPFCHIIADAMRKAADLTQHGPLSDDTVGTAVVDGVTVCQETRIEILD